MKRKTLLGGFVALALIGGEALAHPLDGLSGEEYQAINKILRDAGLASDTTLYPLIELIEPPKADVLAWEDGDDPLERRASVNLTTADGSGFSEAIVNLTTEDVEDSKPATGEPMNPAITIRNPE